MINVFYLDQEGPVAASVDMHFPTPGEHKELEDHEEQGRVVLDYKVQGCMVPLEFQALEAQEAHGDLGHHGAHGVQAALKDLLGPIKKQKDAKNQKNGNG